MIRRRLTSRRPFGRTAWNFPAFSPEKLGEYVVREARVTHWVRYDRFVISINVTISLYNQRVRGFSLAKRLRMGFEESSSPFFVKQVDVEESTITICIAGSPGHLERFQRSAPFLLQSINYPDRKLKISTYTFGVLEVPDPDPDIPF